MTDKNLSLPATNSRSSSPGSGDPKPRVISGSLKDRIAKFSNPTAAPLVPHPFGHGSRNVSGSGGMIGNRLPALDPKTAGIVSGQRRAREDRGMVGNRIPSISSVPEPRSAGSGSDTQKDRAASPASVDSSSASGKPESSNSPITSRSSSPPTSNPDIDLPATFLSATLPDTGGPGTMTPSSTRAEAGEDTTDRSAPPTPVQGPIDPTIRGGHYDLIAPNLKLAEANQSLSRAMDRTSSAGGLAAPSVSASLGSSRASQYDPSSQGSENPQKMMQDVSGISTPTGTPRAEHRELEGSTRGSAMGDDVGDTTARLAALDVEADRDPTPEPPRPASPGEAKAAGPSLEQDPNQADDMADLKAGRLQSPKAPSGTHSRDQNPINNLAEAGIAQGLGKTDVPPHERKHQGGVAGQRMEDVETADEVQALQSDAPQTQDYAGQSELDVRTATEDSTDVDSMATDDTDELRSSNVVHGARAAGTPLDESGTGPMTSGDTEHLKEALLEDRKRQADRSTEQDQSTLQTEEDRDEGMNRREQLVRALDQNPDPNKDLQGGVDPDVKQKAQEVTMGITGGEPPERQDDEPENRAKTPTSTKEGGENDGSHKSGGVDEDDGMIRIGIGASGKPLRVPAHPEEPENSGKGHTLQSETAQQQVTAKGDHEEERDLPTSAKGGDGNRPDSGDERGLPSDAKDGENAEGAGRKPLQVQVEPAPIAQPEPQPDLAIREESVTPTPPSPTLVDPPTFPTPPTDDLDPGDSREETPEYDATPLDRSMLKSFPDVPDEQKPRVEVHVSSPHATPQKTLAESPMERDTPQALHTRTEVGQVNADQLDQANQVNPIPASTPLAKIPGHSKSLSHPPEITSTEFSTPDMGRRDSLGVDGSPGGSASGAGAGGARLSKRASTRRSPKSPLLDDEDPGDFEGGDGWAVIHGQPGRVRDS